MNTRRSGEAEPAYFDNALCRYTDPDAFFPDERKDFAGKDNTAVRMAKRICDDCEHQIDCASYAIARPYLIGIWGGTTTNERQRIRRDYNIVGIPEPSSFRGGTD